VCLQLKALGVGDVRRFLRRALDPPADRAVANAVRGLRHLRALGPQLTAATATDDPPALTPLGR